MNIHHSRILDELWEWAKLYKRSLLPFSLIVSWFDTRPANNGFDNSRYVNKCKYILPQVVRMVKNDSFYYSHVCQFRESQKMLQTWHFIYCKKQTHSSNLWYIFKRAITKKKSIDLRCAGWNMKRFLCWNINVTWKMKNLFQEVYKQEYRYRKVFLTWRRKTRKYFEFCKLLKYLSQK